MKLHSCSALLKLLGFCKSKYNFVYLLKLFARILIKKINVFLSNFTHTEDYLCNKNFWPDLASAHYSNETQAWLRGKVKYVPKNLNSPNVPQARPIKNIWGCLAQKVYEGGWEATTEQQLIDRIHRKLREFDPKMCGIPNERGQGQSQIYRSTWCFFFIQKVNFVYK